MPTRIYDNNVAETTLATALTLNGSETTVDLADASTYPTPAAGQEAAIAVGFGDQDEVEICTYTGKTTNQLTGVTRDADGDTGKPAHAIGAPVRLVLSAKAVGRLPLFGVGSPEGVVTATIGTFYLDTTNGVAYIKQTGTGNTGWVAIPTGDSPTILTANKSSFESTTSTTLQDDDALFVPLEVNSTYAFILHAWMDDSGGTGADIKFGFTVPGGGAGVYWGVHPRRTGGSLSHSIIRQGVDTETYDLASSTFHVVLVSGRVHTVGTAGNLQLRWAVDGSGTARLGPSYLQAVKL